MSDRLMERMTDQSTETKLQFSVRCEECGRKWESRPAAFTHSREREAARLQALREAQMHFNLCKACGRVVCDACFRVCEMSDMCRACAERLGETGESPLEWCADGNAAPTKLGFT